MTSEFRLLSKYFALSNLPEPSYSDEDIQLINQIRANAPPKNSKLRKKHLILGFKYDFDWAARKSIPLFGEVEMTNILESNYFRNIRLYRAHIATESGIARHLSYRVTNVVDSNGVRRHEQIIGIAENTCLGRKLPSVSGIRRLMKALDTDEAPKWYVVSSDM